MDARRDRPLALPNPRLQAPRPRSRLLGGCKVAHHRAVPEAIVVVGARLKRRVRLRERRPPMTCIR